MEDVSWLKRLENLLLQELQQVCTVRIFLHGLGDGFELLCRDVAGAIRDLFWTGYHQALALLESLDKQSRFHKSFMRSRIPPCHTTSHHTHMQLAAAQVFAIHIGDFKFPTARRF